MTPRASTEIRRDRYGLFATVTIRLNGLTATTTMRPDIRATDLEVGNLKRSLVHQKRERP